MPEEPKEPEDDASVLTPEELELEDEQEDAVRKIGENRFVIRPNEDAPEEDSDSGSSSPGPIADTEAERASSPDSTSSRQGAGEQNAPSPASQAQQDAGSRDPASEPSLADKRSSSSLGSASSREDAEAQSASSPDSASPRRDAAEQSSASPDSTSSRQDAGEQSSPSPASQAQQDAADGSATNVDVESRALALEHAAGEYGIDAVVDTGDGVVERRLVADDQIAVFEEFLRWYARQIDPDAAPAATISALLAKADLSE
ncbi:hypothetical protein ACFQDG_03125 [Natronoarchaeum mannanilyticum]|uniref:Uncharacterized protein n=1 Tax=Natronoarchaeum mannanilyticum TaxID=926360 RepID=A0AAV3T8D7_9EURY